MPIRKSFGESFGKGCAIWGMWRGKTFDLSFDRRKDELNEFPNYAADLAHPKVDVIVPWFPPTTQAAKQATSQIPIVMADAGDPVGTELVASLPRPGGNVTGIAGVTAELSGKCIELIRELLPAARRVTALAHATDPCSTPFLEK